MVYYLSMMIKHIKLHEKTKKALDAIKHPGQSYDGVIQELFEKVAIKKPH